jgi:plastocyanin
MDGSVFYFLGGALVLAALVLSYVGIRGKGSFPPDSRVFMGVMVLFGLLVAGTAAYAVANAREEQEHRNEELAHEEAEAAAEEPPPPPPGGAPAPPAPPAGGAAQSFDVTSPDDGSLSYEPDSVQANAGEITLAYDNPSPVAHNINIEDDAGEVLAESDDVTGAATELTAPLVPGEYVFFCSIPGHREGGMEGVITVE